MDVVGGLDVARDEVVATILGDGFKETKTFGVSVEELSKLKLWLKEKSCTRVVMESTAVYWVPIYASLEESSFKVTLANARQVKAIPGRKTDQLDSEWLAYLLRAELVKPSYIPEVRLRDLRSLTRLRARLKQDQTNYKNRVHKILQLCNIRLASRLTDIFGKSGRLILEALTSGKSLDESLDRCPKSIRKKREEIKACVMGALSQPDLFQLKLCLDMIDSLDVKVNALDSEIKRLVDMDVVERISKVPGLNVVSACALIAELGDAGRFLGEKQVGAYAGLVPSVRQSGRRRWMGGITKHGSRWLRRVLVQCALAAIKVKDSRFRMFYLRIRSGKGHNVAIVALARKLLVVVHHLLVTGEEYVEDGLKKKRSKVIRPRDLSVPFEEALRLLVKSGFVVSGAMSKWMLS
jgi:transposase